MANKPKPTGEKLVATNPIAHANYFIEEVIEAGMVLTGTEIKSLRNESPNIRDAYVEVRRVRGALEAYLVNAHIGPYSHGNIWNHEALRARKLLLHSRQIDHFYSSITQKGLTIIPMRIYLKKGRAKVELGLGKGKKKHDKRETLKKKAAEREMEIEITKRARS